MTEELGNEDETRLQGERVAALMSTHGHSPDDLARKLVVDVSVVEGIVDNSHPTESLSLLTIRRLAWVYEVSEDYLLGLSENEGNSMDKVASEARSNLIQLYARKMLTANRKANDVLITNGNLLDIDDAVADQLIALYTEAARVACIVGNYQIPHGALGMRGRDALEGVVVSKNAGASGG